MIFHEMLCACIQINAVSMCIEYGTGKSPNPGCMSVNEILPASVSICHKDI